MLFKNAVISFARLSARSMSYIPKERLNGRVAVVTASTDG